MQQAVTPDTASSNLIKVCQKAITICSRLSHPTQQLQIRKKCAKKPLQSAAGCHTRPNKFKFEKSAQKGHYYLQQAVTSDPASSNSKKVRQRPLLYAAGCHIRLDGQHCPLRTYHGDFSRAEKSSEDITRCLFLINMKWLNNKPN
jgi:hypothetical protein